MPPKARSTWWYRLRPGRRGEQLAGLLHERLRWRGGLFGLRRCLLRAPERRLLGSAATDRCNGQPASERGGFHAHREQDLLHLRWSVLPAVLQRQQRDLRGRQEPERVRIAWAGEWSAPALGRIRAACCAEPCGHGQRASRTSPEVGLVASATKAALSRCRLTF
jgi:hypothetical protein